eukprot:scaffold75123_cov18-Tisochrysis_lutea.AAC.1
MHACLNTKWTTGFTSAPRCDTHIHTQVVIIFKRTHRRTYIHTHTHTHTHTPLAYTVPPAGWDPPFALEKGTDGRSLDSFQFQTRKQLTSHLCMRAPRSFDTGHWVCSLVDIDAGQVHLLTPWAKCVQRPAQGPVPV